MTDPTEPIEPVAPMPPDPAMPAEPSRSPEPPVASAPSMATEAIAAVTSPTPPAAWAPAAPAVGGAIPSGSRPTGLTVAALLAAIIGALLAIGGVFLIVGGGLIGGAARAEGAPVLGGVLAGVGIVAGIFVLLVAVCFLATAIGNWRRRSWSWTLGVIVWIITLVLGVSSVANGGGAGSIILEVAFPIVALFFLWQPDVKRALGRG